MAYEKREQHFANLDAMVAKLGKDEAHRLAEKGLADELYRKGRNMREAFIKEQMKNSAEYKRLREQAKKVVDAKLVKGQTK